MNMVDYWVEDKGLLAALHYQYPQHKHDPLIRRALAQRNAAEELIVNRLKELEPDEEFGDE